MAGDDGLRRVAGVGLRASACGRLAPLSPVPMSPHHPTSLWKQCTKLLGIDGHATASAAVLFEHAFGSLLARRCGFEDRR